MMNGSDWSSNYEVMRKTPKNPIALAIMEAYSEAVSTNSSTESFMSGSWYINGSGDIFLPLSNRFTPDVSNDPNRNITPIFSDINPDENRGINGRRINMSSFKEEFLDTGIDTVEYNSGLNLAFLLKSLSADKTVYGILLRSGSFVINPLHPVVAFLVAAKKIELPPEGELHIFYWSRETQRRMSDVERRDASQIERYYTEYQKLYPLSANIMASVVEKQAIPIIDMNAINNLSENPYWKEIANTNIEIQITENTNSTSPNGMLIPFQITADSILTPYYGVGIIDKPTSESSISGMQVSPMLSGNFSTQFPGGSESGNIILGEAHRQNICTGRETSYKIAGHFTLSRVNLSSMHFSKIIYQNKVVPFVLASKKTAHDIWDTIHMTQQALIQTQEVADTSSEAVAEV